jgi:methionine-gamma-lyase
MTYRPANSIQDLQFFGEFGGVNPSIEDSSTFTFLKAQTMEELFEIEKEGCYLYARHTNPNNRYLSNALAAMENTESAHCAGSGMGSISSVLLQLCSAGDEIVSSRTIYGGTYALMKNLLPRLNIKTRFVDITNLEAVENAITPNTKVLYCEALSNPLLEVSDLPKLGALARKKGIKLVVDNTFTPLLITPAKFGADVVIHSLTKFINGTSDAVGGVACGSKELISSMMDVNSGTSMLLGPVLDGMRSASMLKNMHSLPVRMERHSRNAQFLAERFEQAGLKVRYPGLKSHPQHELMDSLMNHEFGFGGMLTLDMGTLEKANQLMESMQHENLGYLAVSLGFYKTLFSAPGSSTSSEIPEEEQVKMGLSHGIVRFSIGLDQDIERTYDRMMACIRKVTDVPQNESLAFG